MPSESFQHRELKRLALVWAQTNGYPIAAAEVSVPEMGARLDLAAYRPGRIRAGTDQRQNSRPFARAAVGMTAIFECKSSRPDYLRDGRSISGTTKRLETLDRRRKLHEETLRLHCPSIRNGDSLFAEYETLNFERPGYEAYERVLGEMRLLSKRLHENTKFDRLTKWQAANLHYLIARPGLFEDHELPMGWGVLIQDGDELVLTRRPVFHDIDESRRLGLLHRIAAAGTRLVNDEHGVTSSNHTRRPRKGNRGQDPAPRPDGSRASTTPAAWPAPSTSEGASAGIGPGLCVNQPDEENV